MKDSSHATPTLAHCALPRVDSPWKHIDRVFFATLAKLSGGLSPFGIAFAHLDWVAHMACSPGKALALWQLLTSVDGRDATASSFVADRRFEHAAWDVWPYAPLRDQFLRVQAFWDQATRDVDGVQPHHLHVQNFIMRQWLDTVSPSNLWWANPEVLATTQKSAGMISSMAAFACQTRYTRY
ncbi:hypothetical protein CDEF62S_02440 [Castellaniella defragrans]